MKVYSYGPNYKETTMDTESGSKRIAWVAEEALNSTRTHTERGLIQSQVVLSGSQRFTYQVSLQLQANSI